VSHARDKRPRVLFHELELAFCGRSGSGKTTLLERLLASLTPGLRVGYAKHDAHGFEMDRAGKDTWRAAQSGASVVRIQSPAGWAGLGSLPDSPALGRQLFAGCDLVLVEGYRRELDLDKVLFIDGLAEAHSRVAAFVTADAGLAGRPLPEALRETLAPDSDRTTPVFQRDDWPGLRAWLLERFRRRLAARPLLGLVLTGGQSRRMGRDKALLEFDGLPQAERAARLLETCCSEVLLSARPGQDRQALGRPVLEDRFLDFGPAGGILSALEERLEAAWLVLGCDLPFVTPELLAALLAGRDLWRPATAFRDPASGLPEPLCAVWEPRSRVDLLGALAAGTSCPRRVLGTCGARLLELPDPRALENVNRPEELAAARARWVDGRHV